MVLETSTVFSDVVHMQEVTRSKGNGVLPTVFQPLSRECPLNNARKAALRLTPEHTSYKKGYLLGLRASCFGLQRCRRVTR